MVAEPASILIVDDSKSSRMWLTKALGRAGYRITTAADGEQALARVDERVFDLALLDVCLPGMDGIALLRALRRRYAATELAIVMVTGDAENEPIGQAPDHGADDYLRWPFDALRLATRVEAALERKRAGSGEQPHASLSHEIIGGVQSEPPETTAPAHRVASEPDTEAAALRRTYDCSPAILLTLSAQGLIRSVNRYGADKLGYRAAELLDRPLLDLLPESEHERLGEWLKSSLGDSGQAGHAQVCARHRNGSPLWLRASAQHVGAAGAGPFHLVCQDVSETHYVAEQLAHQASHDALTGLINRRECERRLQHLISSAREEQRSHALCYLDLDRFKIINDTCGHLAGDNVLRELSARLQRELRAGDALARLGGDEFAVLLKDCTREGARRVAQAVRAATAAFEFKWGSRTFQVGVSIGIVAITTASDSILSVLAAADAACYAAKEAGRNRIHEHQLYDTTTMRHQTELRQVVATGQALTAGQFELHRQPIVAVGERDEAAGERYELYVRMRGDDGALVPPSQFLTTAERFGLSARIDQWVIGNALDWLQCDPQRLERLRWCSINLSGQSLGEGVSELIATQLDARDVPAEKLCFEIGETIAITNLEDTRKLIATLKARGCQIALDHFGTALSSFSYLKQLPVDIVKIEGSFVSDMLQDTTNLEMVKAINGIAQATGKRTIAQHVESAAILDKLREIGVDFAQGHALGSPTAVVA